MTGDDRELLRLQSSQHTRGNIVLSAANDPNRYIFPSFYLKNPLHRALEKKTILGNDVLQLSCSDLKQMFATEKYKACESLAPELSGRDGLLQEYASGKRSKILYDPIDHEAPIVVKSDDGRYWRIPSELLKSQWEDKLVRPEVRMHSNNRTAPIFDYLNKKMENSECEIGLKWGEMLDIPKDDRQNAHSYKLHQGKKDGLVVTVREKVTENGKEEMKNGKSFIIKESNQHYMELLAALPTRHTCIVNRHATNPEVYCIDSRLSHVHSVRKELDPQLWSVIDDLVREQLPKHREFCDYNKLLDGNPQIAVSESTHLGFFAELRSSIPGVQHTAGTLECTANDRYVFKSQGAPDTVIQPDKHPHAYLACVAEMWQSPQENRKTLKMEDCFKREKLEEQRSSDKVESGRVQFWKDHYGTCGVSAAFDTFDDTHFRHGAEIIPKQELAVATRRSRQDLERLNGKEVTIKLGKDGYHIEASDPSQRAADRRTSRSLGSSVRQ